MIRGNHFCSSSGWPVFSNGGKRDDPLIAGEGEQNLSRIELESLLSKDRMTRDLGVEFMELMPERMVATMQVDERHLQPFGNLHGESA